MDNLHCPKCRGQLNRKKPSKDVYLTVGKDKMIRLWCQCGYYRDEVIKQTPPESS